MTLDEAMKEHRIQHINNEPGHEGVLCVCGRLYPDVDQQYSHQQWYAWEWMRNNEFGHPLYWLKPGTTCLRCGVVVGEPDTHRKVCSDG